MEKGWSLPDKASTLQAMPTNIGLGLKEAMTNTLAYTIGVIITLVKGFEYKHKIITLTFFLYLSQEGFKP